VHDPILADWQIGLGRAAVFTGDATPRWALHWTQSPTYAKFWPQLVRSVTRKLASGDFDVRTVRDGPHTRLIVEVTSESGDSRNCMTLSGKLAGPDPRKCATDIRLQQTGPGRYETILDTPDAGAYFAALQYVDPSGETGALLTGTIVPTAPELRDLHSNDDFAVRAAAITGGRTLRAFDNGASLFDRESLRPSVSSRPVREPLLVLLMGIILIDVAVRRIAWDWQAMKKLAVVAGQQMQAFLTTRSVEPAMMLAALRDVRRQVGEQKFRSIGSPMAVIPSPPPTIERCAFPTTPVTQTTGLWAAKRRAMVTIDQIEKNERGL
jgi:hypothetical protein